MMGGTGGKMVTGTEVGPGGRGGVWPTGGVGPCWGPGLMDVAAREGMMNDRLGARRCQNVYTFEHGR